MSTTVSGCGFTCGVVGTSPKLHQLMHTILAFHWPLLFAISLDLALFALKKFQISLLTNRERGRLASPLYSGRTSGRVQSACVQASDGAPHVPTAAPPA
eukprot:scaffold442_cov268-Pinguiococcus_pyrenoidosus.AAC.91